MLDELDTGIHDIRVRDILLAVRSEISGQLIITTHNTLLMDSDLDATMFYVISKDDNGNRHICCITDTVERVHPKHNIRNRYLLGDYSGIPQTTDVSLKELLDVLNKPLDV